MPILEANFDNEKELENWVQANINDFFPGSLYIPGCLITTTSGKGGVPDGFVFNFQEYEWYVIEAELLAHGVWNHIAEQIIRFVVATQNPHVRRIVRDRLFEHILSTNKINETAEIFETTPERLLQQLELYVEGVQPKFAIFIDDTNQDLLDMVRALSAPTNVYQVRKFIVDGTPQYFSPDRNVPVIETEPGEEGGLKPTEFGTVDLLEGATLETSTPSFKCYRLKDATVIFVKRSKYYPKHDYYWYGIRPSSLDYCKEYRVTHIVFVMGEEGFVKVPLEIVLEYVKNSGTSRNADGSVKHYHLVVTPGPEPELYWSKEVPKFHLKDYYHAS